MNKVGQQIFATRALTHADMPLCIQTAIGGAVGPSAFIASPAPSAPRSAGQHSNHPPRTAFCGGGGDRATAPEHDNRGVDLGRLDLDNGLSPASARSGGPHRPLGEAVDFHI